MKKLKVNEWFNAKVGCEKEGSVVGNYELEDRKEPGDKFSQLSLETYVAIIDIFFKLPQQRLYTWKALVEIIISSETK